MSRLAPTALFALLIACLIGCSSVAPQSPPLAPPLTFTDSQRMTQTATISRDGENYRMLCILEFGGRGLVLVAFTELGQRLLTIEYGPTGSHRSQPGVAAAIRREAGTERPPARVLADERSGQIAACGLVGFAIRCRGHAATHA